MGVTLLPDVVVCAKHVFDTAQIRVDRESRRLVFSGVPEKISDYDVNAIEEAIRIREKHGGHVTVLMATPVDATKTLREAVAMGADRGVMLSDSALEEYDGLKLSYALAQIIKKLGAYDLIICGEASEDSMAAQVGPSLAEWLSIPHIGYVRQLKIEGSRVVAEKKLERFVQSVECEMPLLVTVLREINEPRIATTLQTLRVPRERILKWNLVDAGLSSAEALKQPSTVQLSKVEVIVPSRGNVKLQGDPNEVAVQLSKILIQHGTSSRMVK
jgi:electron transfer flavoprotein beta subunit